MQVYLSCALFLMVCNIILKIVLFLKKKLIHKNCSCTVVKRNILVIKCGYYYYNKVNMFHCVFSLRWLIMLEICIHILETLCNLIIRTFDYPDDSQSLLVRVNGILLYHKKTRVCSVQYCVCFNAEMKNEHRREWAKNGCCAGWNLSTRWKSIQKATPVAWWLVGLSANSGSILSSEITFPDQPDYGVGPASHIFSIFWTLSEKEQTIL